MRHLIRQLTCLVPEQGWLEKLEGDQTSLSLCKDRLGFSHMVVPGNMAASFPQTSVSRGHGRCLVTRRVLATQDQPRYMGGDNKRA